MLQRTNATNNTVLLTLNKKNFFKARSDILKIHSRKMNLTRGINLRKIAEGMPGASGAEVKVSFLEKFLFDFL